MLKSRLPFHRHLKWLCFEDTPFEKVLKYYDNIQFAKITQAQYDECMADCNNQMIPPVTRKRLKKRLFHSDDLKVWRRLGFEEIYQHTMGNDDWSVMGKMLNHPVMRIALDCCLITGMAENEIEQILPQIYHLLITPRSIEMYRKYFFDHADMEKTDWVEYLKLLVDDRYAHGRIFAALTKSQEEVLHLVGLPSKMQFGTMLKNIMNTAHYRFEYYARQAGPGAQDEARKWAKVLMEAGQKHAKFGATDATDFANLIQTEFEYVESGIENITPEMLADAKPQITDGKGNNLKAPEPPPLDPEARPLNDV